MLGRLTIPALSAHALPRVPPKIKSLDSTSTRCATICGHPPATADAGPPTSPPTRAARSLEQTESLFGSLLSDALERRIKQ